MVSGIPTTPRSINPYSLFDNYLVLIIKLLGVIVEVLNAITNALPFASGKVKFLYSLLAYYVYLGISVEVEEF